MAKKKKKISDIGKTPDELKKIVEKFGRISIVSREAKMTYKFSFEVFAKFIKKDYVAMGVDNGNAILKSSLKEMLDRAMESSDWQWELGFTQRKNGQLVGLQRNIVDTGALRDSLALSVTKTEYGGLVNIAYREPYALITHYGGYIQPYGNPNAKPVYLPPRPWVQLALVQNDKKIKSIYLKALVDSIK